MIAALLLMAAGGAVVGQYARQRWAKLGPELFPPQAETDDQVDRAQSGAHISTESVTQLLQSAAAVVVDAGPAAAPIAPIARGLLDRALASAEIASTLVSLGQGAFAYVVVVPNRHEHPQLLRRHAAFAHGWQHHLATVRASLSADGSFARLTAYLFFVDPVSGVSLLLPSFADHQRMLVPRAFAEPGASAEEVNAIDARTDFELAI